jgi:ATP-dependent Clp protease ATP-binding subunit ClpA
VGKTELAKALAEFLFEDEGRMIRLDMSEYAGEVMLQELIGPPPGIAGCQRGGNLTNAVRAQPYTIVLLDEFEKAHAVIRNLFLQVFDEGWLTDGLGRKVSFSDTILIATSNLAGDKYRRLQGRSGFRRMWEENLEFREVRRQIERALIEEGLLSPELRNRFDLISIFDPLSPPVLQEISRKLLRDLDDQLRSWGKRLLYDSGIIEHLAQEGYDPLLGARELKRQVTQHVREEIAPLLEQGAIFRLKLEDQGSQPKLVVHIERAIEQQEPMEA